MSKAAVDRGSRGEPRTDPSSLARGVFVMAKVLVVDDSAVDRRFVGGLLQRESNYLVEFAEDGVHTTRATPTPQR